MAETEIEEAETVNDWAIAPLIGPPAELPDQPKSLQIPKNDPGLIFGDKSEPSVSIAPEPRPLAKPSSIPTAINPKNVLL